MSSPSLSRFDLRKKITPKSKRRSKSRSRTRSYSPPPPPSHPSRLKSKSKKKVEEIVVRNSICKATSEMRRRRSRSRARTPRRAKSGSQEKKGKMKTKKKKKRRRSSSSSTCTSDSSSKEEVQKLEKSRKKIMKLLKDYNEIEMTEEAAKVLNESIRRKPGSGEFRRSKAERKLGSKEEEADRHHQMRVNKTKPLLLLTDPDQVVPQTQVSPLVSPLVSPSVAKSSFKPKDVAEDVLVAGHKKCRICNSYFRDNEEDERQHLAQHHDRVFLVSLPGDVYFYTIEEAIIHLITKVGIKKADLEEKVRKNSLIKNPTNLYGYSCDICEYLDTNKKAELISHIGDNCGVKEKAEMAKHVVYFCRGCQVGFIQRLINSILFYSSRVNSRAKRNLMSTQLSEDASRVHR